MAVRPKGGAAAIGPSSSERRGGRPELEQPGASSGGDAAAGRRCTIRERIKELVAPMALAEVQKLYSQFETDEPADPEKLKAVKSAFIEHLNCFRPQRARRLFSELFVPVWIDEPILLRASRPVPGMIQRVDVGALWAVLCRGALSELTGAAQTLIDRLAEGMLISEAVKTPEARALLDKMRQKAVGSLQPVLGGAGLAAFLDALNRRRQDDIRPLGGATDSVLPLDRGFLLLVYDYLAGLQVCTTALASAVLRTQPGRLSEAQAEREASALQDAEDQVREALQAAASGPASVLPFLLPLTLLHRGHRYTTVALYLRETSGFGARGGPLAEALLGHFSGACTTLTLVLEGALRIDQRSPGSTIKFTRKERGLVEEITDRLEEIILALILGGILESRLTQPLFQSQWQDTTTFVIGRLAAVGLQRVTVVISARTQASHDQSDVVWLIRLIWTWYQLGRRYDLGDQSPFLKWRTRLMEELRVGVDKATRLEEDDSSNERMEHLLRLDQIATALDQKITPFLSVASPGIVHVMADCLADEQPLTQARRKLVEEFLELVRRELKKSPRWQSPDLASLIKQAAAQGL